MDITLIDPGPEEIEWLLDQGLDVRLCMEELDGPSFLGLRSWPLPVATLDDLSMDELWALHEREMASWRGAQPREGGRRANRGPSLIHLKQEIAHRQLRNCSLCAWACGVDRAGGEAGRCGLGARARPADSAVHVGEEARINPTLLLPVHGCALRCRFCQQPHLLEGGEEAPIEPLGRALSRSHRDLVRSWSFIGGNPDESLPAVIDALVSVPTRVARPVVWNAHGWTPPRASALLEGLVDAYVTDVKFGNDGCAESLAEVPRYTHTVFETLRYQVATSARQVVRLLVIPGHLECCAIPALRDLAALGAPDLEVSFEARYTPSHRCAGSTDLLGRPISDRELDAARDHARDLGLRLATPGLIVDLPSESGAPIVLESGHDPCEEPP